MELSTDDRRQERYAVPGTLAVVDRQLVALEVDILDPK